MSNEKLPQKKSVILIWFLSIITVGIYPGFWYIKRSSEFGNLNTSKKLKKGLAIFFLILIIILLVLNTIVITITPKDKENKIDFRKLSATEEILTYSLLALALIVLIFSLFLRFRSRTIMNEALSEKGITRKISWFFTLIFGFFYLQYEINRVIENKEYNKRIGPWVWFAVLLLPIIIGIIWLLIVNFT